MTIPALGIVVANRANLGVEITGVARGSVAEKAGLQVGNIITQIDRVRVWTAGDLAAMLLSERSRRQADGDDATGLNDVQAKAFGFRQRFVRFGARIEPEFIAALAGNFRQHLQ